MQNLVKNNSAFQSFVFIKEKSVPASKNVIKTNMRDPDNTTTLYTVNLVSTKKKLATVYSTVSMNMQS